ncbi:amino acid transporter [Polychaeton citri CBS 116435]|uniref:Amino acid transporter n=1 Tax=Polychaeton citri CBS 116435 TaxID=1314669 RepID=A0A9P4Q077_9PEZI|nr:amino acid transporter [Polychaeton citri CBS 116435]
MPPDKDLELTIAEDTDSCDSKRQPKVEQRDEVIALQNSGSGTGLIEGYIELLAIINFGFTLQAAWEASGLSLQFSLLNGGPASLVYGSLLAGTGSCLIAASLAEMASIDPVVGAQYRWSAQFAPMWPRFWGLFQGWITVFAWVTCAAASPAYLAQGVQSLIILNDSNYVPKAWHTTLLMCAFVVPPVAANLWFKQILNPMETLGAIGHAAFWIASMILLGVAGARSSHEFVWTNVTDNVSGWTKPGVAFGIGLLPIAFPITSFDGVLHMSKEVKKPKKNVPRAMIFAVVLNSLMQFVWLVVVMYRFGDPETVAKAPGGMAIIGIYMNATNNRAITTVFVIFQLIILFISLFNIFASVARLTWAFSQNNGLPFSKYFAYASTRWHLPLRALLLVAVICCLLSLINIGSYTAFNALISLPLIALYISYGIPIAFLLLRKLRGRTPELGPFNLGRYGVLINGLAVVYILYVLSFVALPTILPVTASNMNYAGPLVLAVMIIALVDWVVSGRKRFLLPEVPVVY